MIRIFPAKDRFQETLPWLKSFHLFSFGNYNDPKNASFKSLRVFNDDLIEAGGGFPLHPHSNYEIVTVVSEGALTHVDGRGNQETLRAGEAQAMSAGTGITHSEFNMSERPCRIFQIWLSPSRRNLPPAYRKVSGVFRKNCLVPLASPRKGKRTKSIAQINSDAEVFALELSPQRMLAVPAGDFFLYCFSGKLSVGDAVLSAGDQARVEGAPGTRLRGVSGSPKAIIVSFPAKGV